MIGKVKVESKGQLSLPVLDFLRLKPWNELAKAHVSTLRPSRVIVIEDLNKLPAEAQEEQKPWQVTVYVTNGMIDGVYQWCLIDLPDGCINGYDVEKRMQREWL